MSAAKKRGLTAVVGTGVAATLLSIVPSFEGMVLRGYKDPIGIVTACAGHTKTAVLGRPYTPQECTKLLEDDLAEHAEGVMACVNPNITQGQKAAYISFAFNVGVNNFCKSTMAKKANAGDKMGSCAELSKWTYAGGQQLKGLITRRASERAICES